MIRRPVDILFVVVAATTALAAPGDITTVAGGPGFGSATQVIQQPFGLALSSPGGSFLYVADAQNHVVRGIDLTTGQEVVVAGNGTPGTGGDDGPATSAQLRDPVAVATDGAGNLYIADWIAGVVRRVDTEGTITRFAGTGLFGHAGDGGPATAALLGLLRGVAVAPTGEVYILHNLNGDFRIRRVDSGGTITTVAGSSTGAFLSEGAPVATSRLDAYAIAFDPLGRLLIADGTRVWRIDAGGIAHVFAGNGGFGFSGDGGPATGATLSSVYGLAVDGTGNTYLADANGNYRVRRVSPSGIITTVAGNGISGFAGDGGPATAASFRLGFQGGLAVHASGDLFIADVGNARLRRVDISGTITTVAGNGGTVPSGDGGPALDSQVPSPSGVAADADGNFYVVSRNRVRRVDSTGTITTVAGNGSNGFSGDGGPATAAGFDEAWAVALSPAGDLYISDARRIRRVSGGVITTIAGGGDDEPGDGGPATMAHLGYVSGVAVDEEGSVYFTDYDRHKVRKVDGDGILTTIAGTGVPDYSGDDGPATAATLRSPSAVAVDAAGTVYVADRVNDRVRRIDLSGTITTIAGDGTPESGGDGGPATLAQLRRPTGVAVDAFGVVYIAEEELRVRRVAPDGIITTVAGRDPGGYGGDGGPAVDALLVSPSATAIDPAGNLLIADVSNARVRRVETARVMVAHATIDTGGGNVSTSDGEVGLAIPPGLFDTPTPVSITTGLVGSAFAVGSTTTNLVGLARLAPENVTFDPPIAVTFTWPDTDDDGLVDGTLVEEANLQLFRNGMPLPGTTTCDAQACTPAACCDRTVNAWTVSVAQFSEYALGTDPCEPMVSSAFKIAHVDAPAGDDSLKFKGTFTTTAPLDPVGHGLELRLFDAPRVVLDALLPSGAYDRASRSGWKANSAATKWTYVNKEEAAPGKITKVSLADKSRVAPGLVAFKVVGKRGAYGVSPDVRADVVVPSSGQCSAAAWEAAPPARPSCVRKGSALVCK